MFDNKVVLVTGGTGSFGREIVSNLLKNYKTKKIIVFSRDEQKQFFMNNEFGNKKNIRFFIGDIRDEERLNMASKGVNFIIHAAAMKHVMIAEYNPIEAIKTNVLGAQNIIISSIKNKVDKVIALSTDKAVNPINLYGSTKLAAEKLFVAANNLSGKNGTIFSVARYGNVLASRGSVIPLFLELRKKGLKNVPITDKRMTRFVISISDAVEFVINSLKKSKGGEIFVPKIPSVKIVDLAKAIMPKCNFKIIGIRPGEKLHEVLLTKDEFRLAKEDKNSYVINSNIFLEDQKNFNNSLKKKFNEDFEYNSYNNPVFLNLKSIVKILKLNNIT